MEINKIYNENCLDTMARMEDSFLDLTVTSPPYDNLRTYKGFEFDWEAVLKELYRTTKKGGVVVWVVGDATVKGSETGTSFRQALYAMECGFNLHDTMIWNKKDPIPLTHNRYEQSFEYMFIFSKGRPKTFNAIKVPTKYSGRKEDWSKYSNKDNKQSKRVRNEITTRNKFRIKHNTWLISVNDGVKVNHPASFPSDLANDHIISWSNEGDLIYDPFMGSGTTAKAAKLNNRNWIGSEISEEYCKIIAQRLQECGGLF